MNHLRASALMLLALAALVLAGCGTKCQTDADCGVLTACDSTACIAGSCIDSPPGCEYRASGGGGADGTHERVGEASGAICTSGCASQADCPGGQTCSGGACVPFGVDLTPSTSGTLAAALPYVESPPFALDTAGLVTATVLTPPSGVTVHVQTLVGFSGGAFSSHATDAHAGLAYMAGLGYVGLLVNYRLSGVALYPAPISDAYCGLRWMGANAAIYGASPAHIITYGASAGVEISAAASLTAASPPAGWDDGTCLLAGAIPVPAGVIGISGVYDFNGSVVPTAYSAITAELGFAPASCPVQAAQDSPQWRVGAGSPDFYLAHHTMDNTLGYPQMGNFIAAAKTVGKSMTHVDITTGPVTHDPPVWQPAYASAYSIGVARGALAFIAAH